MKPEDYRLDTPDRALIIGNEYEKINWFSIHIGKQYLSVIEEEDVNNKKEDINSQDI